MIDQISHTERDHVSLCGMEDLIGNSDEEGVRFIAAYIAYQSGRSYEELGDDVDISANTVAEICEDLDIEDMTGCFEAANTVNTCIQSRYLGECSLIQCTDEPVVTDFISREVSVSIKSR